MSSADVPLVDDPRTLKPLLQLAVPMFYGQILDMLVGLTDTLLTGRFIVDPAALSAMNLTNYVLWFFSSIFMLISVGTTSLVARSIGAKDHTTARHLTSLSLVLGAMLAVVPFASIQLGGYQLARLLNLTPAAADYADVYWRWVSWALPAILFEQIGGAALRAAGRTRAMMSAMIVTNLVDMAVSYVLVTGPNPVPNWGWDGLAIGSVCGYYCGAAVIVYCLRYGDDALLTGWTGLRGRGHAIRRLLSVGIPGGIEVLVMIFCQLLFVRIVNQLGDRASGAHGLAIRLESVSFYSATAFQVAAATMVGQFLGAGKPDRARHAVFVACVAGEIFICSCSVLLYLGSDWLAALFVSTEQSAIANLAAQMLRIVCFAQPFLILLMVLTGAQRGAGDTRAPLFITLVGFFLVRLPLAAYWALPTISIPYCGDFAGCDWGLPGAWYAMAVDLMVRTGLTIYRFRQGAWSRISV